MSIMIGVDPHKGSHTAVAIDGNETVLDEFRVRSPTTAVEEGKTGKEALRSLKRRVSDVIYRHLTSDAHH